MAVHQLVPIFHPGDATGQAAIHFRLLLRRLGIWGELYAGQADPSLRSLVRPISQLRPEKDDWVFYHHGISTAESGQFLHLRGKKAVVYHNITPARFYPGTLLEEALIGGRAQLAAMAPHADLSIGVSELNCAELRACGHRNVHPVSLFVEPERFALDHADPIRLRKLKGRHEPRIHLLFVGRVLPHKRIEDLLLLHREVLRLDGDARLTVVGGFDAGGPYFRKLRRMARGLGGIAFLGKVSHAELVAAYRAATVFVSMSEHEGFCVPLLEAMASELPILAYAAAAVPQTLSGSGLAFTEKQFALLAELCLELSVDPTLRRKILQGQRRRLGELSAESSKRQLAAALGLPSAPAQRRSGSRRKASKPRVAMVVQRYGDVSGGAEMLARQLAQKLSVIWDLTVLTTCAKDHLSWENEFRPGEERDGRVTVIRFPIERPRKIDAFNDLSNRVLGKAQDRTAEEHWIAEQGPSATSLFEHLSTSASRYDGYIFFTYLYSTTVWGLPLVADRALLVSTAHDEAPLKLDAYREVFERPRGLICLTPEEAELIEDRFFGHAPIQIASVGIEAQSADPERFRARHGIDGPYLFYVGRVEGGKGIPELISHHRALAKGDPQAPELVLAGASSMEIKGRKIRYLGRISDQEKLDGLKGALAAVVPSRHESLSLLTLEAFAQGTPALVNGHSEVLAGQIARSRAGKTYRDAASFRTGIAAIARERLVLSKHARAFAQKHSWAKVTEVYRRQMERITESRR